MLELLREKAPVEILAFHKGDSNQLGHSELPKGVQVQVIERERPSSLSRLIFPLRPYVINGYSQRMEDELRKRANGPGTLLWASRLMMGKYLSLARELGYLTLLDEHNVESDLLLQGALSRIAYWPQIPLALQCRYYEAAFCKKARRVLAVSETDAARLRTFAPSVPVDVFPNCIDTDAYKALHHENKREGILFVGTLSYYPNQEGLIWFVEKVLPILTTRLQAAENAGVSFPKIRVAGANPPPLLSARLAQAGIELLANPESILPVLNAAQTVFVPILSGSGTRLKIMEAMAAGRSVVSTHKGAEGLNLQDQDGILLASDPSEFADALIRLHKSPPLRKSLEQKAIQIAASRFDWRLLRKPMATLWEQLTQETQ